MTVVLADPDLQSLSEDSPAMLWRGNTEGRCVYLNGAMRAFWGLAPHECTTFDWATSLLAEDHAAVFGPFATGMRERQPFECEGRYRRADGEIRILRTRATPYGDASGAFAGMIGVNEDITELRSAEQALARRNAELRETSGNLAELADRFRLATAISGLAMSEHDGALRYLWAHNVPGEPNGRTPSEVFGDEIGKPLEELLRRTIDEARSQSAEFSFNAEGRTVWVSVQTAPILRAGTAAGVIASALDITARKSDEQRIEVIARELAHRVKNAFALCEAIVRQSARNADVPRDFLQTLESRIRALGSAQDALSGERGDRVGLRELVTGQLSHLSGIRIDGPGLHVSGKLAPYLALCVHELGTNAAKYGSLSVSEGHVEFSWRSDDGFVVMNWREVGGPAGADPARRGFGTDLLTRIFAAATDGEADIEFTENGLAWRARFPA